MADYTFNGHALVSGDALIPQLGFWTSDVYASDAEALISVGDTGPLSILGVSRVGTVVSAGREAGFVRARVVGGRGKYDAEIESRSYRGYNAGAIALDCIQDAGEVGGDGWSSFNVSCVDWTRAKGPLRDAMRRLGRLMGAGQVWRVAHDGSIAFLSESWRDNSGAVDRDGFIFPQEQVVQFFPAEGSIEPGQTIKSFGVARRVTRVEYRWSPSEGTCRAWYALP